jgi:hypothetical protein
MDPDPTPFFSDFKDAKKYFFFFIFFCSLLRYRTRRHFIFSLKAKRERNVPKNVYYKCFLEFILATINGLGGSILSKKSENRCALLNNFMRKGKEPEPDPGGQKNADPHPDPKL